ncbi:LRR containing protein [Entamoeba marina]
MSQLEHVYLMNVVLYFTQKKVVIDFININKKCLSAVKSLKINPLIIGVSYNSIRKIFTGIETYQLLNTDNYNHENYNVPFLEYVSSKKQYYSLIRLPCVSKVRKSRKLHYFVFDESFEKNVSEMHVLRSLILYIPSSYYKPISFSPLFKLNEVLSLKSLTLYCKCSFDINELTKLKEMLPRVRITIIFESYGDTTLTNFMDLITKTQGVNAYFTKFEKSTIGKNIILDGTRSLQLKDVLEYKEHFFHTLSLILPSTLELTSNNSESEFNHIKPDSDGVRRIDLSPFTPMEKLILQMPSNPLIAVTFPTSLKTLDITSRMNEGISYSFLSTISLLELSLNGGTNKSVPLPSTLKKLSVTNCSNCKFRCDEQLNLDYLQMDNCNYCVLPFCNSLSSFQLFFFSSHSNVFEKYGNETVYYQFFNEKIYQRVYCYQYHLSVDMKQGSFCDGFDTTCFKQDYISLRNFNLNTLICGDHDSVEINNSKIKILQLGTLRKVTLRSDAIENIAGKYVNDLLMFNVLSKTQFNISKIDTYTTDSFIIPHTVNKTLSLTGKQVATLDLSPIKVSKLVVKNINIDQLIVPTTLESFSNDNSNIVKCVGIENTNVPLSVKEHYSTVPFNNVLPAVKQHEFIIKKLTLTTIDASEIHVNILKILDCSKLKHVIFSNSIQVLVVANCPELEELDLSDYYFVLLV